MTRTRTSLLALPTLALALGAGVLAPTATAATGVTPRIQGTATDGKGKPLLDVQAQAVDAAGNVVATALSYNNTDAEGDDQPGYYWLDVRRGSYDVTLSKRGFEEVTYHGIAVTRRHRVFSLGETPLRRLTETVGKGPAGVVRVGDKVKVDVTVSGKKPTGKVTVKEDGDVLAADKLVAADDGQLKLAVGKLGKGSHTLKVTYAGSEIFAGSSDKVTVTVKGRGRHDRPTNALLGA